MLLPQTQAINPSLCTAALSHACCWFQKEELVRGDVVSPEEAAVAVVDTALSSAHDLPGGRFYRHGEEIGW